MVFKKLRKNKKGAELIEMLIAFPIFIMLVFVMVGSMQTFATQNQLDNIMHNQMREATSCVKWINEDYAIKGIDENTGYGKLFMFGENKKGFLDSQYTIKEFKLYQLVESGSQAGQYIETKVWGENNFSSENIKETLDSINSYITFKDSANKYTRWKIGNRIELTVGKTINTNINEDVVNAFTSIRFPGAKQSFTLFNLRPTKTVISTIENDSNGVL